MSTSDYYEQKILDHMLRGEAFTPPGTVYAQLHQNTPYDTGVGGGALSIGRVVVTFNPAAADLSSGYTASLATPVDFPNTLGYGVTVSYASLWDASTGGNCLWIGSLDASVYIPANHTFRLLTLTVQMT